MYKLMVVAGPSRGSSFAVHEGETRIGRQQGNDVVLPSAKVSKSHCVLVVNNSEITVKDRESANGTFVNGVLTQARKLRVGDRIGVGEYVLEVARRPVAESALNLPALSGIELDRSLPASRPASGNVISLFPADATARPTQGDPEVVPAAEAPQDFVGRLRLGFEQQVMPLFYGLNRTHDWKWISAGIFAAFVLFSVAISVYPLLSSSRTVAIREVSKRAVFMARQISERNAPALRARTETRTEVDGAIERAEGVQTALLIGLDSRIIAPADKAGSYLTTGPEALMAVKARKLFDAGRETGIAQEAAPSLVVAVEPVKIAAEPRNAIVAMAVVSIDARFATSDYNQMGLIFSQTVIVTGVIGAIFLFVLYRLTLKPYEALSQEIDQALKGSRQEVSKDFQVSDTGSLWDLVNSALQRANRAGAAGNEFLSPGELGASLEDYTALFQSLDGLLTLPFVLCDAERRVQFMNRAFEELSGLRAEGVHGQELVSVLRDEAQGALISDLTERAVSSGGSGITEDFEFSGVPYRVHGVALGPPRSPVRAFLIAAVRSEG